ncbi:hypothetical protein [Sporolituus thermophilus]|uniref:Uncharacterized protein n=1 Tax=Sporolituus thermophilus DSM 23256 TaxID=1123285 RepID=A0A1G7JT99_9FIRM|nr:hypothetical protein [Sporolituus thermophilus]SDF27679.1 hypothetical protein SAMN05660235_01023 [Sporolituus thermophilus DSM 23256]
MKVINNIDQALGDDLKATLKRGAKVSIAASYFSIYAYQALKQELENIKELRFIFTSPTFIADILKKKSVSSISRNAIAKEVFMGRSLRLN